MKSLDKVLEVQTEFAKSAYETFVAESQKIAGLYTDLAKQTFKPLEGLVAKFTPAAAPNAPLSPKSKARPLWPGFFVCGFAGEDYCATRSCDSEVPIELKAVTTWLAEYQQEELLAVRWRNTAGPARSDPAGELVLTWMV